MEVTIQSNSSLALRYSGHPQRACSKLTIVPEDSLLCVAKQKQPFLHEGAANAKLVTNGARSSTVSMEGCRFQQWISGKIWMWVTLLNVSIDEVTCIMNPSCDYGWVFDIHDSRWNIASFIARNGRMCRSSLDGGYPSFILHASGKWATPLPPLARVG